MSSEEPDTAESASEVAENKPVLEPEEIDALMASMAPDEQAEAMFASLPPLIQPQSVEAYDFSVGGDAGPGKYPLFVNVQERLVETMNEQWGDVFKREVTITNESMTQKRYLEIIGEEKSRVYFAYTVEGHGRMMLAFETSLIVAYVDAMLGGTGEAYGENHESLSPVEHRLAERIAGSVEKLLEEKWKPVHEMDFHLFKLETDPQFLSVAGAGDDCFVIDFEIKLDESMKGIFTLCYPRAFLEPILDNLRSTVSDDAMAVDEEWEAEMGRAMESVPLSIRVELGTCTMDIGKFLKLSPGDLLPLSKGEQEPAVLWIGAMPMFDVMAGSQDGKLAIEIMNDSNHGGAS